MTRTSGIYTLLFLASIACAPPKEGADNDTTTSLPAIDTLKAATDSVRDSTATMAGQTKTPVTGTKTSATTKAKSDSIIGYDKVTPFDPTKKRLDTVKKRP